MRQRVLAAALTAAMGLGMTAPALADGAASTRNIIIFGSTAAVGAFLITNYNHKVREKREEQREVRRRQAAYRDWFYKKYGYYPTQEQFEQWYKQTYGVIPQ
jgi:hypothetical protein